MLSEHDNVLTKIKLTELFRAAVFKYLFVGRVESNTPHHVSNLGAVDQTVSTVPKVEQVEHFFHVCVQSTHTVG